MTDIINCLSVFLTIRGNEQMLFIMRDTLDKQGNVYIIDVKITLLNDGFNTVTFLSFLL